MKQMPEPTDHDWSRLDAMTQAERHAAALGDPDAQPLTPQDMKRMRRTPQARVIRRALASSELTDEEAVLIEAAEIPAEHRYGLNEGD
jgi:putative transcriptional regulator